MRISTCWPQGQKESKKASKKARKQERPSKRHHLCRAIHSCGPRQHHPSVAGLAAEQANQQPGRHLVAWSLRSLAPQKQEASNDRARSTTCASQPAAEQAAPGSIHPSCGVLLLERVVVVLFEHKGVVLVLNQRFSDVESAGELVRGERVGEGQGEGVGPVW